MTQDIYIQLYIIETIEALYQEFAFFLKKPLTKKDISEIPQKEEVIHKSNETL